MRAGASDNDLLTAIRAVWTRRADRYSELRATTREHPLRKVEMYYIGG